MQILRAHAIKKADNIAYAMAVIVALLCLSAGFGSQIDDMLREQRQEIHKKEPSGKIGIIAIDDQSIAEIGAFPWSRATHGQLIEKLQGSGIERLAFDVAFVTESQDPAADDRLADAIGDSRFPVALALPTIDSGEVDSSSMKGNPPIDKLTERGGVPVSIWFEMNKEGAVERIPTGWMIDESLTPTIAGWLADVPARIATLPIDWSISDKDMPTYSYSDILENGARPEMEGMSLIVGAHSSILGDSYAIPGGRITPGARIHAVGAETLVSGALPVAPVYAATLIVLLLAATAMLTSKTYKHYVTYGAILVSLPAAQWELARNGIVDISVGSAMVTMIFLLIVTVLIHMIRYFYSRMTENEGTGIPNLTAMKLGSHDPGATLVMSIRNHVDIISELGPEGRDRVMAKVAKLLEMGSNGRTIYQVDASTFAWRGSNDIDHEITQIESLLVMLRTGVSFGQGKVDIHAMAGIEKNHSLSIERSVSNAMIASTRAAERGIAWEIYEATDSEEMWKISVVSEISNAIENEDLWVAYQPKVDSSNGAIIGAEALVRWKHPTRGDVRPDAFIPLLEKANRTDDLTRFMLNRAVSDFSQMPGCTVAVNASPLMIGTGKLYAMVKDALERNDFDSSCLTVEVTESERFTRQESIKELEDIKALGVKISIDDYGMGNSTVNYLKILPADELKIDRSFISNMLTSHSDRIVVGSTIRLAHEMGLKVVAEGVESADIQTCLREMGCDFIQGYHTGRPVCIEEYMDFARIVNKHRKRTA